MNPLAAIALRDQREQAGWDAFAKGVDSLANLDTAMKDKYISSGGQGSYGIFGAFRGQPSFARQESEAGWSAFGKQPSLADVHRSAKLRGLNHDQGVIDEQTSRPERNRQFELNEEKHSQELAMKEYENMFGKLSPDEKELASVTILNTKPMSSQQKATAWRHLGFAKDPAAALQGLAELSGNSREFADKIKAEMSSKLQQVAQKTGKLINKMDLSNFMASFPSLVGLGFEGLAAAVSESFGFDKKSADLIVQDMVANAASSIPDEQFKAMVANRYPLTAQMAKPQKNPLPAQGEAKEGGITKEQLENYLSKLSDEELAAWMKTMGLI
jgi:hypothetical protein